jgi:hypothetical protein
MYAITSQVAKYFNKELPFWAEASLLTFEGVALTVAPLLITLAGNGIPLGSLNSILSPLGFASKDGLFFTALPLGAMLEGLVLWKEKRARSAKTPAAIKRLDRKVGDLIKKLPEGYNKKGVRVITNEIRKKYRPEIPMDQQEFSCHRVGYPENQNILQLLRKRKIISEFVLTRNKADSKFTLSEHLSKFKQKIENLISYLPAGYDAEKIRRIAEEIEENYQSDIPLDKQEFSCGDVGYPDDREILQLLCERKIIPGFAFTRSDGISKFTLSKGLEIE